MYRLLWPICVKLPPPMYKRFWRISKPHICSETSPSIYILISVLLWCWLPLALWRSVIAYLRGDTLSSVQVFTPKAKSIFAWSTFFLLEISISCNFNSRMMIKLECFVLWRSHMVDSFIFSLSPYTHTHTYSFCIYNFYIQFTYVNIYSLYIKYMCI